MGHSAKMSRIFPTELGGKTQGKDSPWGLTWDTNLTGNSNSNILAWCPIILGFMKYASYLMVRRECSGKHSPYVIF